MTLIAIEWDDDAGRDGRGACGSSTKTRRPITYREILTTMTLSSRSPSWPRRVPPPSGWRGRWGWCS